MLTYNDGGAIRFIINCVVASGGNSMVTFYNNKGTHGGAAACAHSTFILYENSTVTFSNNKAMDGGATKLIKCKNIIKGQSVVTFTNNSAGSIL